MEAHFRECGRCRAVAAAAAVLVAGGFELGRSSVFSRPEPRSDHAQTGSRIPPEMMVVVSNDAKIFHLSGCHPTRIVAHQFPSVNTLVPFTARVNIPNLVPIQVGVLYGILLSAQNKGGHLACPALVSLSNRTRGAEQDSGAKASNRSRPSSHQSL